MLEEFDAIVGVAVDFLGPVGRRDGKQACIAMEKRFVHFAFGLHRVQGLEACQIVCEVCRAAEVFLGQNPIEHLVGAHTLHQLPQHAQMALTGHTFFPNLISQPFSNGLDTAFGFAIVACLIAAGASLMRGGRYTHTEPSEAADAAPSRSLIRELEESHAS